MLRQQPAPWAPHVADLCEEVARMKRRAALRYIEEHPSMTIDKHQARIDAIDDTDE